MAKDAADLSLASETPDFASDIDSDEDRVLDVIARLGLVVPAKVTQVWLASFFLFVLKAAAEDGTIAHLFDHIEPTTADREMVSRVLAEIIDSDKPRLHARCLDFVFGLNLCDGRSEKEIGELEGVGKAAVSKRCRRIKERFPDAPCRGMKSEASCRSYSRRQTGKRAKPMPAPWPFVGLLSRAYGIG